MAEDEPQNEDDRSVRSRQVSTRRRWEDLYELLRDADAAGTLADDDLERYSSAAYLLGHVEVAVDAHVRDHRRLLDSGRIAEAVRSGCWVAFMLINRGDVAQAGGWVARMGRLVEGLPTGGAERGYLAVLDAFRLVAAESRYADGGAIADDAVDIGRATHDEDLVALGLTVSGRALIYGGAPGRGLERLDEAMAAVVTGALSPVVAGTVYCSLIDACQEIAELRRAGEWTEALTRWCDRQEGMVTFTGQCLTHRARVLRLTGRLDAAAEEARLACERFAGAADEAATGAALYELAEVHRLRGSFGAAEETYRRAGEWGHDPQPGLALLRLAQGDAETAAGALRRSLAECGQPVERLRFLAAHVEVMLATGDEAAARSTTEELTELAGAYGTEALRAEAAYARGGVEMASGDATAALAELRIAAESWHALDAPYEVARTRLLIASACEQLGDSDTARIELGAARRVLATLGIVHDLGRLEREEKRPHGLTGREMEVLRLVATGMTNQAIGAELHLATKTIDRHVAGILAKLGVPSRTAATAYAYEHRLL